MGLPPTPTLRFEGVDLDRVDVPVLHDVDWAVSPGERWVVLGPNGSGKTTLLQLASGYLHPTRGKIWIFGHRLGAVDVRRLRERIGVVSPAVARKLVTRLDATSLVVSASRGDLEPWWHEHPAADWAKAEALLGAAGFAGIAGRPYEVLSEGERQQVLLARSLMAEPELLLLDEPAAGLDVGGRERLLARLAQLAADPESPPTVLVTHHVEEIPPGFRHVLLLRDGKVVVQGAIDSCLTSEVLSETFATPLQLERVGDRLACRGLSG